MNSSVFFLSTGRCGTQWVHDNLLRNLKIKRFNVVHEPLSTNYESGKYYRNYDNTDSVLNCVGRAGRFQDRLAVKEHFESLKEILKTRRHIEVGWPCFGAIPFFIENLENVKIVNLIRHPVYTALSIRGQKFFEERKDEEDRVPDPINSNVIYLESNWSDMNSYQRSLWFWYELFLFGQEIKNKYNVPFMQVRFEDLLNSTKTKELCEFLEVPSIKFENIKIDKYARGTVHSDWKDISLYPHIVQCAESVGYTLNEVKF